MSEQVNSVDNFPGKASRILLQAMQEIIGCRGIDSVLDQASLSPLKDQKALDDSRTSLHFNQVGQIQAALEALHGRRGGQGLALRSGRACFKYGLREYGSLLGVTDLSFRLQPLQAKLRIGLRSLADVLNRQGDQRVSVVEKDGEFLWVIERCPVCWGRSAESPVCHLVVGFLQEALYWLSGGKIFNVEETHCIACGEATCTFRFAKRPLE